MLSAAQHDVATDNAGKGQAGTRARASCTSERSTELQRRLRVTCAGTQCVLTCSAYVWKAWKSTPDGAPLSGKKEGSCDTLQHGRAPGTGPVGRAVPTAPGGLCFREVPRGARARRPPTARPRAALVCAACPGPATGDGAGSDFGWGQKLTFLSSSFTNWPGKKTTATS